MLPQASHKINKKQRSLTIGSIVIGFDDVGERSIIVNRRATRRFRKISTGSTDGESYKSKPFERADGKPLNVTEGDGEKENLRVVNAQINVDHVSRRRRIDVEKRGWPELKPKEQGFTRMRKP
jgi:hypothetical protein